MGFWCCDVMIRSSVLHLSFDMAILFGAVYASLMVLLYMCISVVILLFLKWCIMEIRPFVVHFFFAICSYSTLKGNPQFYYSSHPVMHFSSVFYHPHIILLYSPISVIWEDLTQSTSLFIVSM